MDYLGSVRSGIRRGFCTFVFFIVVTFTLQAGGQNGQLLVSPSNISFGSVSVGSSLAKSLTLTNSGGPKLTITQMNLAGTGFSLSGLNYPVTLSGGQSVSCVLTFTPMSAGADSGGLLISFATNGNGKKGSYAGANNSLTVTMSGTGATSGQLAVSSASLNFGSVQTGSVATLGETVTNTGNASVTISGASATGAAFSEAGPTLPLTLAAGQSAAFSVTFSPSAGGSLSGALVIASDASNPTINVALNGTGVTPGQLSAAPATVSFGSVQDGSTQTVSETVTNTGGSAVTISGAAASGAGFSETGPTLPVSLAAGQSAVFKVTFAPSSSGSASGSLAITSNASNSTLSVALSGTGVAAGQLAASPSTINFGTVQTGTSQTLTETVTNTGGSSVTISGATASGAAFSESGPALPLTLAAGQSASFSVVFSPASGGSLSGNLAIASNASNSTLNVALNGSGVTPGVVASNPASLAFGSVATGTSSTLGETLTNSGGSTLTISQIAASGSGFSFSGINPPVTLTAGQSVNFTVAFAPSSGGSATGSLVVSSNGSNPMLSVPLTGTGNAPGQLAVSPSTINFGNVVDGSSQSQSATLTASNGPVTVSGATVSEAEFSLSGTAFPVTIPAGYSMSFTVTFAPTTSGAASANVTFASNASNSSTVQTVSGSGTPPPQHSAALSWNASTSNNIVSYNVYRGTVSGGPYTAITSAPGSSTSDTDNTVAAGQTYYYVVTAVDSGGVESPYSNQTAAVIPSP